MRWLVISKSKNDIKDIKFYGFHKNSLTHNWIDEHKRLNPDRVVRQFGYDSETREFTKTGEIKPTGKLSEDTKIIDRTYERYFDHKLGE